MVKYNFCTLFDSFYLSRGLVMHESLKRYLDDFHLYIFAFDDISLKILKSLNLEKTTIVSLEQFENSDLINVKSGRTKAEYCWTCTSSIIEYVLDNYDVSDCTYVDADICFYSSPSVLLEEIGDSKTVLITEHRYSWFSKIYEEKRAGRFCVQFINFKNTDNARVILKNWKNQCIEWCFARYEDGKFGDQKYLDEWPVLYKNVKISDNLGAGVAPWNVKQYMISKKEDHFTGTEKKTRKIFNLIFYHFHYVRFMDNGSIDLGWNKIPTDIQSNIYIPYIFRLMETERFLETSFADYKTKYFKSKPSGLKEAIKYLIKRVSRFNIVEL